MPSVPPTEGDAYGATFGTLAFFLVATLFFGRKGLVEKFDPCAASCSNPPTLWEPDPPLG